jgi:D-sedoheptulose 7-phosphate isomerase
MKDTVKQAIQAHGKLIDALEQRGIDAVVQMAQAIIDCFKNGGRLYVCGNGGSAADCQHISGELVGRFRKERKALPVVALSTDTSILTSVGNDYGFEEIFRRQVQGLVEKGDILWALSTSGASANILAAAQSAKEKGVYRQKQQRAGENSRHLSLYRLSADQRSTGGSSGCISYHLRPCGGADEQLM